jgi:hypothetical protein
LAKRSLALILLTLPLSAAAVADESWIEKWYQKEIASRVTMNGFRRLGWHSHRVTGDQEAFNLTTTYGMGGQRFTDVGSVYIAGRQVLGVLNFNFSLQDSRFDDPQSKRFTIDVKRGDWAVQLGDIQGRLLNTNRLAHFSKTLRGSSVGYESGGFKIKAMSTEVRGEPRTISLNGTNSPGPYFLQSSQVVRGSETVEIDGVRQSFGSDYTIDYDLGAISFINRRTLEGRIVPPTSTILVTYEVFGFSGSRGRLLAAGTTYDMGSAGRLGVTVMRQTTGSTSQLSTKLDRFQGFGPASTPYFLSFEPLLTEPIVIRADGVLQVAGIDYVFDLDNPSIFYFNRYMPSTSTIDVLYTPKPTTTVNGDREVLGFDYRLPLGKQNSLTVYSAEGRLFNSPTPSTGTAKGADLRYQYKKLQFNGSFRDVPEGYVSIETTGFNRNEKAHDLRLRYEPSKRHTFEVSHRNTVALQRSTAGDGGAVITPLRFTKANASYTLVPTAGGIPLTLTQSRTASRRPLGGETTIDTTSLRTSKSWGRLSTTLEASHQTADAPAIDPQDLTRQRLNLDTLALRSSYSIGQDWGMSLSTSFSKIKTSEDDGFGRDVQFGLTYSPSEKLSGNLSYIDSDAGDVSSLDGFSSGYGYGFNGNGYSGGAGTDPLRGTASFKRVSVNANYDPSDVLSLGLGTSLYRSKGTVSSNSEISSVYLTSRWDLGTALSFDSSISYDKTNYIDSAFKSNATSINVSLDGAPSRKFSYRAGASWLLTGGNSDFRQDSGAFDLQASYRLTDRHSLSALLMKGSINGYLPQDITEASLTYQYRIWRGLAVNLSYRHRDIISRDQTVSSGAFTSNGFDLELAFNFGM